MIMLSKMKNYSRYVVTGLDYLLWAALFGVFTYIQWHYLGGHGLNAYVNSILNISIALIIDKIRRNLIYKSLKAPLPEDEKELKAMAKKDVGSLKTSLYLFYIFALVASHTLALDASINVSENIRSYFQTIEKGILVLFAIDNFLLNLVSDDKRSKKYLERFRTIEE